MNREYAKSFLLTFSLLSINFFVLIQCLFLSHYSNFLISSCSQLLWRSWCRIQMPIVKVFRSVNKIFLNKFYHKCTTAFSIFQSHRHLKQASRRCPLYLLSAQRPKASVRTCKTVLGTEFISWERVFCLWQGFWVIWSFTAFTTSFCASRM